MIFESFNRKKMSDEKRYTMFLQTKITNKSVLLLPDYVFKVAENVVCMNISPNSIVIYIEYRLGVQTSDARYSPNIDINRISGTRHCWIFEFLDFYLIKINKNILNLFLILQNKVKKITSGRIIQYSVILL